MKFSRERDNFPCVIHSNTTANDSGDKDMYVYYIQLYMSSINYYYILLDNFFLDAIDVWRRLVKQSYCAFHIMTHDMNEFIKFITIIILLENNYEISLSAMRLSLIFYNE